MRAFAAVFTREVFERRMVFLVGFCCGIPTLVASALHGWNTPGNAEVRLLAASVGGLALAVALALLYGGSMIPGETAEKRISFWFSRPIPAGAIWAGKLLAAIFVSLSAGFLVFLPGWLTGPAPARKLWGIDLLAGQAALAALALVAGCVFASHAVVTVARLKSPWALLDLTLAITLAFAATSLVRTLVRDHLGDPTYGLEAGPAWIGSAMLAGAVALAFPLATLAQVAAGRADARRAHGAFSFVLWSVLGSGVLAVGAFAWWCSSARATDLRQVAGNVAAARRGSWTAVGGALGGARGGASFLFDTASLASIRLRGYGETFSQNGARAAWGEPDFGILDRRSNRMELVVADLASGRAVATGIVSADWPWLTLSPSGRRLASLAGLTISAYDVSEPANPRQLATFRLEHGTPRFAFVDEDTIRVFPRLSGATNPNLAAIDLEIRDLSLSSKKSLVTGRLDAESLSWLRLTADGRYLVGTRRATEDSSGPRNVVLLDGRTGARVATLAEGLQGAQARLLVGDRLVVAGIGAAGARALFFEGEKGWSAPARTVELGPAARVALGGEIEPGRVAISLFPLEEKPKALPRAKLVVADAASGAASQLGEGLVPADRMGWWIDPVMTPPEAGAPWTSLFLDADGRLVRLDPATGKQTVLLGKGK